MRSTTKFLLACSAAALLASGCDPTISGQEGNLEFTYDEGPVGGAVSSSPLAVGARLGYTASPTDSEQKVSFDSAMSDDDSVVRVLDVQGGMLELEAAGEGDALIDVEAVDANGEAISDSFEVSAATVDALEFDNPCAKDADALYLVDHDIRLHYTMRTSGRIAAGYGYYPVELSPADAATVGETSTNGLLPLTTASNTGDVTIESTVDDSSFTITLAEVGDIDGMMIFEDTLAEDLPVAVDADRMLHLLPTIQGLLPVQDPVPVCQSDITVEVSTTTPDICEVSYGPDPAEGDSIFSLYEPNALRIRGTAEGTCEYSVSIPNANGGAGVDENFTIDVVQGSQEGGDNGS